MLLLLCLLVLVRSLVQKSDSFLRRRTIRIRGAAASLLTQLAQKLDHRCLDKARAAQRAPLRDAGMATDPPVQPQPPLPPPVPPPAAPLQRTVVRPPADVYVTGGGDRYHTNECCRGYVSGKNRSRRDPCQMRGCCEDQVSYGPPE